MRSMFRKIRGDRRLAAVAAAGSSSRMGGADKLMEFLDNVPVLMRTLTALAAGGAAIDEIVIAAREDALVDISDPVQDLRHYEVHQGGAGRREPVPLRTAGGAGSLPGGKAAGGAGRGTAPGDARR